jgi:hypothetical protein
MCRCTIVLIALSIAILLLCHSKMMNETKEKYANTSPEEQANLPHYDPINGSIQEATGWNDPQYTQTNGFVKSDVPYNYYLLDDGYGGVSSVLNNVCSPSCCNKQYETSTVKAAMTDPNVDPQLSDYASSNMTCSGGNSGCVCMTKQQQQYLENRGGNR